MDLNAGVDFSLYCITDDSFGRTHEAVAQAALAGGAGVIQLRDKARSGKEMLETARRLRELTRAAGALLIVNDDVDLAIACRADGVHIGRNDMPVEQARLTLPVNMLIGVSATSFDEAVDADRRGASYIGAGPVFATGTKEDSAPPFGCAELKEIVRAVSIPVVAIGGITENNIGQVAGTGAEGAAVISAVAGAPDMRSAAVWLKYFWRRACDSSTP